MLEVSNLSKTFGNFTALDNVSFHIKPSTIHGFLGKNGAGKSTTMNILSGLIEPSSGDITFEGEDFLKNKKQYLSKVGYAPQEPVFYNYMTSVEYLAFIGTLTAMDKKTIKARTEKILTDLGLINYKKKRIGGYSGGMKQRLAIATALFNDPKLLILDEPTSALDPEGRLEVLQLIKTLRDEGKTILLSTHILNDIERICDDVTILDKGKVLISSTLKDLTAQYIKPIFDLELKNTDNDLFNILKNLPGVAGVSSRNEVISISMKSPEENSDEIVKAVLSKGNSIVALNQRKSTLEDIFIGITGKKDGEENA